MRVVSRERYRKRSWRREKLRFRFHTAVHITLVVMCTSLQTLERPKHKNKSRRYVYTGNNNRQRVSSYTKQTILFRYRMLFAYYKSTKNLPPAHAPTCRNRRRMRLAKTQNSHAPVQVRHLTHDGPPHAFVYFPTTAKAVHCAMLHDQITSSKTRLQNYNNNASHASCTFFFFFFSTLPSTTVERLQRGFRRRRPARCYIVSLYNLPSSNLVSSGKRHRVTVGR